ncbi:2'-5' RNA ligase family protein [Celerinatantimonas yamalensis]|uniref:2'-5' RNA ligase family protein n=1 Tax=Celerinatantimonas yamalensis TaxID=559956 RepID=A0ABW9G6A0_9GAMM
MKIYIAFLVEGLTEIEAARRKYDYLSGKVPLHLTLVFPLDVDNYEEDALTEFFSRYTAEKVSLSGVTGSLDNLVFLTLTRGNDFVIEIHNRLYNEFFSRSFDTSHTFFPHLTVGRCNNRREMLDAINDIGQITLDSINLNTLAVIQICEGGERKILSKFKLCTVANA